MGLPGPTEASKHARNPSIWCNLGVLASSIFTHIFFFSGLKIILGPWPDTMAGQRHFRLVKSRFLTGQKKKVEKREIILVQFSICDHDCIFRKSQNIRQITGEDLVVCSRIREWATGQHDRQV